MQNRRIFFGNFFLGGAVSLIASSRAHASEKYRALDEDAIPVRVPGQTMLCAIESVGKRLIAVGEHGVIVYSDDKGASWIQAKVPVNVTLTAVTFAGSGDGWAVGNYGVILHSFDGGETWEKQLDGFQAEQLTLAAAQAAVAAKSTSPGEPLALARANHLIGMGPSIPFLSVIALDQQRVLAVGAYRMAMYTTDGGKTWQDWSLNIPDPVSHNIYDIASISGALYLVGEAGLVFRSGDGGASFDQLGPTGAGTLFGICGTSAGGLLVYGVAGLLFRSDDGGKSWTKIQMPVTADLTAAVETTSGTIILASESGLIYRSTDQGQSFEPSPERLPMAVYALALESGGRIVTAGSSGIIALPQNFF